MIKHFILAVLSLILGFGCKTKTSIVPKESKTSTLQEPFLWENATVYFLLTDRFYNADKNNDFNHPVDAPPAALRGFMGGDVKGITQKIKEGYFDKLGITALWMTPLVENITGSVDEGTGRSYGFHGYWTKDWTAIDPRIGSKEEVAEMVSTAHAHGIKVLMDAVINHTGPVTSLDTQWPDTWVKTGPRCVYKDMASTVNCTLVANLPDVKTESKTEVTLPSFLVEKWKSEGRYDQEMKELDDFFKVTKYPRRPYYYIVKWLVDLIKDFGIDGYRVDTAKHTEAEVWKVLFEEAKKAYALWKKEHPEEVKDATEFYMVGEVYGYNLSGGRWYDYSDQKVDFFANGFQSMINFEFKYDAKKSYDSLFVKHDMLLNSELKGKTVLNYLSSHDDGSPFDKKRVKTYESASKLLLAQGGAQIYYGDESARSLDANAEGDAVLRSFMNWEELAKAENKALLNHWQKLGQFRKKHIAVGAGRHKKISDAPYTFSRTYTQGNRKDKVVIALDVEQDSEINVSSLTTNGKVKDAYTGKFYVVVDGKVKVGKSKVCLFEEF